MMFGKYTKKIPAPIIVIIIVLIIIAVFSTTAFFQYSSILKLYKKFEAEERATALSNKIANWNIYSDPNQGVSFKYPPSWTYQKFSCNLDGVAFCPLDGDKLLNCGVDCSIGGATNVPVIFYPYQGDLTSATLEEVRSWTKPSLTLGDDKYKEVYDEMVFTFKFTMSTIFIVHTNTQYNYQISYPADWIMDVNLWSPSQTDPNGPGDGVFCPPELQDSNAINGLTGLEGGCTAIKDNSGRSVRAGPIMLFRYMAQDPNCSSSGINLGTDKIGKYCYKLSIADGRYAEVYHHIASTFKFVTPNNQVKLQLWPNVNSFDLVNKTFEAKGVFNDAKTIKSIKVYTDSSTKISSKNMQTSINDFQGMYLMMKNWTEPEWLFDISGTYQSDGSFLASDISITGQ